MNERRTQDVSTDDRFRIRIPGLWLVLFLAVLTAPLWIPGSTPRPAPSEPAAVDTTAPAPVDSTVSV
jgi:hypothetical protein